MTIPPRCAALLLATSALVASAAALAQDTPPVSPPSAPAGSSETDTTQAQPDETTPPGEEVEVSIPGGTDEIIVTGRVDRNIARNSEQVVSVLSSAEIARTGEGNIAGALSRVTGLSVVGSGLVYVRGLGDRYSSALLNGSPLPSPEPLRRVVPLDLFPSGVIASSLVQKSYSVNFPGEFGGGVINLTTKAVPRDPFLTIGAGLSIDSETTGQLGYTYRGGGRSDWTGFDDGTRDIPPLLAEYFASGANLNNPNEVTPAQNRSIAGQLVNFGNAVVQRVGNMPPNGSVSTSAGTAFDVGSDLRLGVIFAAGYSSRPQTRDAIQQTSLSADLGTIESDFRQVNTNQQVVVNALLGLGAEFGDNRIRWTNLFIRDTIKQARLAIGNRQETDVDFLQQRTAWFERQLIDTQIVGEFKLGPDLNLDLRAAYANSQREAPDEISIEYARTNSLADPFGDVFVNRLNNGARGDAEITFSDLDEDLYSGGLDLTGQLSDRLSATFGGYYSRTDRRSSRRNFLFVAPSSFPAGVDLFRPDFLLQPSVIDGFGISLIEVDTGTPAFRARLENVAGYVKANWAITDALSVDAGVRFEHARQQVDPIAVFATPIAGTAGTFLVNEYWLPAATVTWELAPGMQVRVSGSKTIARPQFRELIFQRYFDPDSNRPYIGNPLLVDSELTNGEARFEYYFAPEQRLSLSGFYKRIERPIETFITGGDLTTSFANAPSADLYGGEVEAVKYFDTAPIFGEGAFWADRRFVAIANYTFSKSRLSVKPSDVVPVFGAASSIATDYFRDGDPLTGQSDHIANLQLGLEDTERLSQQTLLISYASDRVVSRGLNGSPRQPDVIERPGLRIDFVAREEMDFMGSPVELKFEARNLTGEGREEFQEAGSNRIDTNSYDIGRVFSLSVSTTF
ncbi:TonB-dependent receptor domain-containing protein [Qipengyuania sediminis]|uniref:TonB-dependent receptor domain-containing protein n=1 Tax=Qipengyuania sediminis TaxID=1532023 RepID=UPI00105A1205|nr:TonB-dependent receptor [Qipengyuania sediminis]